MQARHPPPKRNRRKEYGHSGQQTQLDSDGLVTKPVVMGEVISAVSATPTEQSSHPDFICTAKRNDRLMFQTNGWKSAND